jgi:hypothetical protein
VIVIDHMGDQNNQDHAHPGHGSRDRLTMRVTIDHFAVMIIPT